MFQTFAVTYALMKIGVEAGHPDFGIGYVSCQSAYLFSPVSE
jgi:hypothetical protein